MNTRLMNSSTSKKMKFFSKAKTSLTAGVLVLGLTGLAGCSSTPVPNSDIAVAKTALTSAVAAGGAEFAPVELKTAQDKLDRAEKLVATKDNDKYLEARRLAVEASVDAKAAETKALATKSQKSLQETQDGQSALKEELQRQQQ